MNITTKGDLGQTGTGAGNKSKFRSAMEALEVGQPIHLDMAAVTVSDASFRSWVSTIGDCNQRKFRVNRDRVNGLYHITRTA